MGTPHFLNKELREHPRFLTNKISAHLIFCVWKLNMCLCLTIVFWLLLQHFRCGPLHSAISTSMLPFSPLLHLTFGSRLTQCIVTFRGDPSASNTFHLALGTCTQQQYTGKYSTAVKTTHGAGQWAAAATPTLVAIPKHFIEIVFLGYDSQHFSAMQQCCLPDIS